MTDKKPPRLIPVKDAAKRTALSRATIYRLLAEDKFPKPLKLHNARIAFVEAEIDAWIEAKIASRDAEAA